MYTFKRIAPIGIGVVAMLLVGGTRPADAGCGCTKPPPPVSAIRPNVTYAGSSVTLRGPTLQVGEPYRVVFASGTANGTATVDATATERRDLADGVYKPTITVALPNLPLGPTHVEVIDASGVTTLVVPDDDFTVAPQPVVLSPGIEGVFSRWQAAVGRDHTVYLSFDLSGVTEAIGFAAAAGGYPLHFDLLDVLIYNTQGVLMQTLDEPVPGWIAFSGGEKQGSYSDWLEYQRHEFKTYYMEHEERAIHALDPTDENWHLDGTPHLDHNHLIVAIAGYFDDGSLPVPGATKTFKLYVEKLDSDLTTDTAPTGDETDPSAPTKPGSTNPKGKR